MSSRYLLALDAGTTVVKAALATLEGGLVDIASRSVEVLMPHRGWCEMDMDALWRTVCEALQQLRQRNQSAWPGIEAIGLCGQGDGMWPVDEDGRPVRNAMLWNDTRCGGLIDYDGINKRAVAEGVTPFFPGCGPVLLRWLKDNEPENYSRVAKALHCTDWLGYRLSDRMATDHTNASTALLDVFGKEYAYSFLDDVGIPQCRDRFPDVVAPGTFIGKVTPAAQEETGIAAGTPVLAGAIDVLAVAAGCGMLSPGQRGSIIGTTLGNYVVLDEASAREYAGEVGSVLCHILPGTYIRQMSGLSGASTLDWVRREIMGDEPYPQLEEKIAKLPVGSDGVLYHPYIYGERAPFRIAGAFGSFFGLRVHHTRYHMARAAFEGMSLSLYDCYNSLPPGTDDIVVAGGAARSGFVCQLLCDCMGTRVLRNRGKELGILGVIRLLQMALGADVTAADDPGDAFTPDMEAHSLYMELYQEYRALQTAMEPFWRKRGE